MRGKHGPECYNRITADKRGVVCRVYLKSVVLWGVILIQNIRNILRRFILRHEEGKGDKFVQKMSPTL